MSEFKKTWAINWQDGMLISEKHLNETQRYVDELARRVMSSVAPEYGLILNDRAEPSPEAILDWRVEMVGNNIVQVRVLACRAMAPDGSLIFIYPEAYDADMHYIGVKELPDRARQRLSIFVSVNEGKYREISGDETEEEAGRPLYRIPDYTVTIAGSAASKQNALKIGQIVVENGEAVIDERYIPPCVSNRCHKRLQAFAKEFYGTLQNLGDWSRECYRRLVNRQAPQGVFGAKDPEATMLLIFSRHLAQRLADTIDIFRDDVARSSPRQLTVFFKSFFRNVTLGFAMSGDSAKQLLFALWMHHLDGAFEPADFDRRMENILKKAYSHEHISEFIETIYYLLKTLERFFQLLLAKEWSSAAVTPQPPKQEPIKPPPKPPQDDDLFEVLEVPKH